MLRSIPVTVLVLNVAVFAFGPTLTGTADDSPARRPNIVFIVADDLGYGELGSYGGTEIPTPHLDALADDSLRFTDGYVTAPYCAASRAALMTGRYQTRFGFEFNPVGAKNEDPNIGLPVGEETVADRLMDSGYATALIGKWHLGGTARFHPQRRGFMEFFGFLHEGHYFVPEPYDGVTTWLRRKSLPDGSKGRWVSPDGSLIWSTHMHHNEPDYNVNNPIMRSSQPVDEQENLTDAFTREACDFITRRRHQPFFLCLAYNAVHSPLQGEPEYMERFAHIEDIHRRIFAAMLAHLDDSIGRVRETLDEQGLAENTLIFFLSDNGGPTKELTSSNAPLRGGKGMLYEGGVRVPMMVSWPARIRPGVVQQPVTSMDAVQTALDLAGVPAPGGRTDGQSWIASDDSPGPDALTFGRSEPIFWRMGHKAAIRDGNWKLVRQNDDWELYNLKEDLSETTDLSEQRPDKFEELKGRWDEWNAEQVDPLW